MLRTNQLIRGSRIKKGVDPSLRPTYQSPFSVSRAPKIALDEIQLGQIKFERSTKYPLPIDNNNDGISY
jgi:hypothetical protein